MIDDDDNAPDEQGHGTHVAGTIAAELTEGETSPQEDNVEREQSNDEGNIDRELQRSRAERSDHRRR